MSYSKSGEKVNIDCDNAIQIETGIETVRKDQSELKIQIVNVLLQRDSKWIIFLISCNSIVVYYLWNWSISTNSIALKAYVNTVAFNICALTVCLISIWVEQNSLRRSREFAPRSCGSGTKSPRRSLSLPICVTDAKAASISALGPEKYEVLALLLSSCLILVLEFFVAVEAVARIGEQPVVHEGRLGLGAVLGLLAHLATILAHPDASLNHVVCKALPCPTLGGANPILAGNLVSVAILAAVHVAVHLLELYTFDTAAAFAVIGLIVASMLPLAFYTASVILQKLSHHMNEQLDKCLREALIIDGVLEFRNERFWTQSFGKLAGSLEVRIRKNADEHYVLQRVVTRLSKVVSTLNVQEFREPIYLRHNSVPQLPLEYYVDELLPGSDAKKNAKEREQEEEEDEGPRLKIEEILESEPSRTSQPRDSTGYATMLPGRVNCLFRDVPMARNALLMGNDDLYCPVRLYTVFRD